MKKLETIQLKIPAGTASGSKLTFTNYGEEPEIGAPSDFEVTVIEIPTPQWQRDGDNLIYTMEISLQMALLGFSETIVHLSGERILVDRQDKTTTKDTKHMIMGKGLSNK